MRFFPASYALLLMALMAGPGTALAQQPRVELETDLGDITLELYPDEAPVTVENFLTYVQDGFYDGTIFHRVMPDFMIQGGGYTFDFVEKETRDPIVNESDNELSNETGTIAMARTADPDSATAQFYVNLVDNEHLDESGYAVFGRVIEGMEVLREIAQLPRGRYDEFPNAPNEPVRILDAARLER